MVEHRTLNPLVPSSSLGLSIPQNPVYHGVLFCIHTELSPAATEIAPREISREFAPMIQTSRPLWIDIYAIEEDRCFGYNVFTIAVST
jgi:hypothetical protein